MMGLTKRMLFGENMSCQMPSNCVDVRTEEFLRLSLCHGLSDLREVADNQEVFTHPESDQSIVVEILEYVEAESDEAAIRVHFEELASSNEAAGDNSTVVSMEQLDVKQTNMNMCSSIYILKGQQQISKFKETSKNIVDIYVALFRIAEKETDILLTLNEPVSISPQSSSHCPEKTGKWDTDIFIPMVNSLKLINPEFLG